MYNSEYMLLARKIAREEKEKEVQEKKDSEEARSLELFEKADQAYMLYKEGVFFSRIWGRSPSKILFVSSVITRRRRVMPTPSTVAVSMKRMRLRISEVQPVWTKHFSPIEEEEEESEEEEE